MKSVGTWFNNLNSETQFKVVITFMIVLAMVYYFAIRPRLQNFGEAATPRAELAYLALRGIKPSFPDATYSQTADMLYEAMKGLGTKFFTVRAVYAAMQNDADIIKLDLAFGERPGSTWWGGSRMYSLQDWINGDLTAAEVLQINNSLRAKGITKTL
jgi:hypothetical protein